ncbi:pyroglutamyl-peptidase I [Vibrio harveyi]
MKKILICGFEPFGGESINPALEAVRQLKNETLVGGEIITCSVPVVRYDSINEVVRNIENHHPDYVITIGQAAGRTAITPERIAINIDDFRIPDNAGNQPIDEYIIDQGPDAYFTSLPIKAILKSLQQEAIPCQISNTAGTFVCNHLFYGLQHYLRDKQIRHGFVHIPLLPEQDPIGQYATMSLTDIVKGLKILAQTTLDTDNDIIFSAGQIC